MDVGQGQAVLLEWQGGRMVIDGGGFAAGSFDPGRQILAPALTDNRPPELDYIVNTHPDTDHLRGLLDLMDRFRVAAFVRARAEQGNSPDTEKRDALLTARGIPLRLAGAGDRLELTPGLVLEVLHPPASVPDSGSNNNSLVLRLTRNGRGLALLCGDLEKPGLRRLLAAAPKPEAEVLVIPHHGSGGSFSPELYDAGKPGLALVSCAYGNQWHFPDRKVRAALAARGIPLLDTARHGQIGVSWDGDGRMTVHTARPRGEGETEALRAAAVEGVRVRSAGIP
jgi:competence protein ComEC